MTNTASSPTQRPLVSVCCVTFNQVDNVSRALESFVSQQVEFPVEVLVHDDCSSDGTREVVAEFAARYPHMVVPLLPDENQYSKGVNVLAKVRGLARGKYVALCEGDDFWSDPQKLSKQVAVLEAHPEVVMTGHKVIAVNADGEPQRYFKRLKLFGKRYHERDLSSDEMRSLEAVVPTCSRVIRNIPIELPPEAKQTMAGDAFLQVMLADYGSYKYLENVDPSYYRLSSAGVWSRLSRDTTLILELQLLAILHSYFGRVGHDCARARVYQKQTAILLRILILRGISAAGLAPLWRRVKGWLPR